MQSLNARYYDSELLRFVQPDWFEATDAGVGTNGFSHVANDPVNLSDPGGGNETYSDYGEDLTDEQLEQIKKDFEAARRELDRRVEVLGSIVSAGGVAATDEQIEATADVARSLGASVAELSNEQIVKTFSDMKKVRKSIGKFGEGCPPSAPGG